LKFCCDNNGFADVPMRENESDIASLLVRLRLLSENGNDLISRYILLITN